MGSNLKMVNKISQIFLKPFCVNSPFFLPNIKSKALFRCFKLQRNSLFFLSSQAVRSPSQKVQNKTEQGFVRCDEEEKTTRISRKIPETSYDVYFWLAESLNVDWENNAINVNHFNDLSSSAVIFLRGFLSRFMNESKDYLLGVPGYQPGNLSGEKQNLERFTINSQLTHCMRSPIKAKRICCSPCSGRYWVSICWPTRQYEFISVLYFRLHNRP